jgi:hypothetical protein
VLSKLCAINRARVADLDPLAFGARMRSRLSWLKRNSLPKVALLGMVLALTYAADAAAISVPIHISGTGGEGVFIRPEPNTSHPATGWMPEGASPDYHCFVWGQNINGVPIWFNVTYNGVTGYYASYYDDSSYHSNEELTAKYGIPLCGSAAPSPSSPAPAPAPPPPSGGGSVYSIMNAEGGIYFRNSPKWTDTSQTPGVGVYNGDQVQLICGAFGEAYGPYANRWWSYVQNLTRPNAGKGWVNAHFINDGMPANQPSPGEGTCPSSTPGSPGGSSDGASSGLTGKSVFYWPPGEEFLNVADMDVPSQDWINPVHCDPHPPGNLTIPPTVNTLAGWSLGRLGPMYWMNLNRPRWPQIHTIILFDPGAYGEMSGSGCDHEVQNPSINQLLAEWLRQPGNELLILTGHVTEDWTHNIPYTDIGWGEPKFTGLWNFYFHNLWFEPPSVRARAVVCDYENLGHEDVLKDFYQVVKASAVGFRPDGCPVSPDAPGPTQWSP